jgi:hypothetical protein
MLAMMVLFALFVVPAFLLGLACGRNQGSRKVVSKLDLLMARIDLLEERLRIRPEDGADASVGD